MNKKTIITLSLILVLLLPFLFGMSTYYTTMLILISVYAIAAMSLNLLLGFGGLISIGSGAFLHIGAYTVAILSAKAGLPFWLTVPMAGILSGIVGFLVGLPATRLRGHFLAIVTLGLGLAVKPLAMKWDKLTNGYNGIIVDVPIFLQNEIGCYYLVIAVTFFIAFLINNIIKNALGRGFIAIRESEVAAMAVGVNIPLYKTMLFTISAFFTGIGGGLHAYLIGFVSPTDFSLNVSFILLAMIIIGGVASIPGAVIGAVVLTIIPHFTNSYVGMTAMITGLFMILTIIFLPNGLVTLPAKLKSFIQSKKSKDHHPGLKAGEL